MTNLSDRAMLAQLSVHLPKRATHDKALSAETLAAHGVSDQDMGRFTRALFSKSATAGLLSAATALRVFWEEQTLPWTKGTRILPSANYMSAISRHRELRVEFEQARDDFLARYTVAIEDARAKLNGMFDESDYPPPSKMVKRIAIELDIFPLPSGTDFRVNMADDEYARITAEIDRTVNDKIDATVTDLWNRTHKVVSEMLEKLSRYQEDPASGKVLATFRDSAVNNLRGMVDLLGRLNVTDNPDLEHMRQRLSAQLCKHDADALRDNVTLRESAVDECKAVLSAMAGYCGEVELDMAAE